MPAVIRPTALNRISDHERPGAYVRERLASHQNHTSVRVQERSEFITLRGVDPGRDVTGRSCSGQRTSEARAETAIGAEVCVRTLEAFRWCQRSGSGTFGNSMVVMPPAPLRKSFRISERALLLWDFR